MPFSNRSLLIVAAALMVVVLPAGVAAAKQKTSAALAQRATKAPADAQMPYAVQAMPCGKRTEVVKMLRDNFGETPIAQGQADTGAVAEVFISSKGSWTIVATSPNGMSCMVGAGEKWRPAVAKDGTI
jgi:hypothetical protein